MTVPADQAERDKIRNDLDVTMLVEAAAGTGKTTNLVKRMVNLVRTGRATPATIAAITFTVKAAAQLREKFQEELDVVTGFSPSHDGLKPVATSGTGFIGTTHAFCARLLRERPVEAGLDPEFEELDQTETELLKEEFWSRWYEAKAIVGDPLLEEAREAGLDRWILRSAFLRIVDQPDVTLVSVQRPRPDLKAIVGEVFRLLDRVEPHLPTSAHRDKPDDFEILMRQLMQLRASTNLREAVRQHAFLQEANHASRRPVQKRWPHGPTAKQLGLDYQSLVTNTIRPALERWSEYVHRMAIDLLRPAAAEFAAERRRNGTLTFQDLLLCARDLLRDHPKVRLYFQKRFTRVLVDEFQDTDPVQAEVLMYLTGENVEERNWRKARPRAGSLFIVGDPKQSIYRFRRADITTYLEVKKIIRDSGGEIVRLWTNYRSVPAICTYVNEAFKTLFDEKDVKAGLQAAHVDLESIRAGESGGVYSLETAEMRYEEMAAAEAEVVGRWIQREVMGGKLQWEDVLLVSFQRRRLGVYASAFERLGIPYEVTGGKAFHELSELEKAMPLLRAVVMPEDQVAVVAFLRGPLCGVDDDALYRYRSAGGSLSPFVEVQAGSDARIERGLRILREGIDDSRRHPPAATIGRLFDRVGLLALSASGERPGTRSGNLLLALSIARELSSQGETLARIVDHLDDLLEVDPDIEDLDIDPSREHAVQLMNLHQVKGLQAPVVFLVDPADEWVFEPDLFVDRSGDESIGHFVVTKKGRYQPEEIGLPVGWSQYKAQEAGFLRAERMRQLYVAATRAGKILVVGFRTSKGVVAGAWRELAGRVKERLVVHPAGRTAGEDTRAPLRAAMDIAAKFEHAREASYDVTPITKIAHASHAELVKAEEGLGKGTSWGRVLHRLFEAMLRDESLDVRLYAENLLKDEERDPVELSEVMRVVDAVRGSALWSRVKAADERYVEIPFALTVDNSLLHGTIDLVFREGDRWYIIDYKSDSTANRLDALVAYYKPQVEHYAKFWSQLTGAATTAGLFFVDGLIEKWI